jgi:hypothetical protein
VFRLFHSEGEEKNVADCAPMLLMSASSRLVRRPCCALRAHSCAFQKGMPRAARQAPFGAMMLRIFMRCLWNVLDVNQRISNMSHKTKGLGRNRYRNKKDRQLPSGEKQRLHYLARSNGGTFVT